MTPYPFLHSAIVDRTAGGPHAVHVRGGRGVGKSTVLGAVAEGLSVDRNRIVQGREPETAKATLRTLAAGDGAVLIDDLDEMFTDEVHEILCRLLASGRRVVVTSTLPPDVSLLVDTQVYRQTNLTGSLLRIWSDFTQQFHPEVIDPWPSTWHDRTNAFVRGVLDEKCRADNLLVAEWTTAVVQLSGGHPTLLDPSLRAIEGVHGEKRVHGEEAKIHLATPSVDRRRQVYEHLEEALFSSPAFRRVRRVAKEMQATAPDAHAHLVENARADHIVDFDAPVEYRRVLTDSGLVYRSPQSKKLVVAGELLRRTLGGTTQARRPAVRVVSSDADRGIVSAALGGRVAHVDLRGNAWKIVKMLHEHPNEVVSVAALMKKTHLDHAGIRSAIQRVKGEFAASGLDGVIENVWGQGYRFCDFPLIATTQDT